MRAAAMTLGLLLCATACSSSSPAEQRSSTPAPVTSSTVATPPAVGGARPLDAAADPLPAGRYTKSGFTPVVSFHVGAGWHAVQDVPGLFDVEQGPGSLDVIAVQFARPTGVATARDAVAQLRATRGLVVRSTTTHRTGAAASTRVLVDNADPDLQAQRFVDALTIEAGTLSLGSGRRLQIDFVDTSDGLLAIIVGGSVRRWETAEQAAEPVLRSVRLLPA